MDIPQLDDLDVHEKTVLVQSNLDVPLENGRITDDSRLRASLESIQELLEKNCRVILLGHIGRPEGKRDPALSLEQITPRLRELLHEHVTFLPVIDKQLVKHVPKPGVAVLENIRMWPGEDAGDKAFAQEVAALADAFINDDYIDAHRAGAISKHLPDLLPSAMGRTLRKEWDCVRRAIDNPDRPLTVIIGGAKKDKLDVVEHVLPNAEHIILGGVLANTFLAASGVDVKASKHDQESIQRAQDLLARAGGRIELPTDCVAAAAMSADADYDVRYCTDVPDDWMILDAGPATVRRYQELLARSKTIVWGGPIGVFEIPAFSHGTQQVAKAVAQADAYSLVAGGDSSAAIKKLGYADAVSHVSIGGGVTLHLIAGDQLPAIQALRRD